MKPLPLSPSVVRYVAAMMPDDTFDGSEIARRLGYSMSRDAEQDGIVDYLVHLERADEIRCVRMMGHWCANRWRKNRFLDPVEGPIRHWAESRGLTLRGGRCIPPAELVAEAAARARLTIEMNRVRPIPVTRLPLRIRKAPKGHAPGCVIKWPGCSCGAIDRIVRGIKGQP